jgi:hypothetical protein
MRKARSAKAARTPRPQTFKTGDHVRLINHDVDTYVVVTANEEFDFANRVQFIFIRRLKDGYMPFPETPDRLRRVRKQRQARSAKGALGVLVDFQCWKQSHARPIRTCAVEVSQ